MRNYSNNEKLLFIVTLVCPSVSQHHTDYLLVGKTSSFPKKVMLLNYIKLESN